MAPEERLPPHVHEREARAAPRGRGIRLDGRLERPHGAIAFVRRGARRSLRPAPVRPVPRRLRGQPPRDAGQPRAQPGRRDPARLDRVPMGLRPGRRSLPRQAHVGGPPRAIAAVQDRARPRPRPAPVPPRPGELGRQPAPVQEEGQAERRADRRARVGGAGMGGREEGPRRELGRAVRRARRAQAASRGLQRQAVPHGTRPVRALAALHPQEGEDGPDEEGEARRPGVQLGSDDERESEVVSEVRGAQAVQGGAR